MSPSTDDSGQEASHGLYKSREEAAGDAAILKAADGEIAAANPHTGKSYVKVDAFVVYQIDVVVAQTEDGQNCFMVCDSEEEALQEINNTGDE